MPPIELGSALPVGAVDVRTVRNAGNGGAQTEKTNSPAPAVARSDVLDPGQPPVDTDRVDVIRKAIESGSYPVIPMKVADAMIAAGLLLRNHQ